MNTRNEILAYVRSTEPVPVIDIIKHISHKYPSMVNSVVTYMINRNILFVDYNNCITTEPQTNLEKDAIIYILNNDRVGKHYLLKNCSNKICRIVKKFFHNKYLINVSTNNWTIDPKKWKEVFHDIVGLSIEESKILGKRLSEHKKIYKDGNFLFSN